MEVKRIQEGKLPAADTIEDEWICVRSIGFKNVSTELWGYQNFWLVLC